MNLFTKDAVLEKSFFLSEGKLKPDAVLSLFQRVAKEHVIYYGVGPEELLKQNLLWVVVQTAFEVVKPVSPGQAVILATWSLEPRHAMVQREYTISTPEGECLIKGTSSWILMDVQTRTASYEMKNVLSGFDCGGDVNFKKRPKHLRPFDKTGEAYVVIPGESDFDRNLHVNNVCYASYMMQALQDQDTAFSSFLIDYRKEMRHGDVLEIYTLPIENGWKAEGFLEDGTLVFIAEGQY